MSTRSSGSSVNTVLSLSAALLSAAVGVWLLTHTEAPLRAAGAVALASAIFALAAAFLRPPAPAAKPTPAPVSPPTAPAASAQTPAPVAAPTPRPVAAPASPALDPVALADGGALRLLAKLQEQGRLLDFAMEDIRTVSDAQVAAVARVVHTGCRATLQSAFELQPLHPAAEGATVTLAPGFDPEAHRLLGHVAGTPPFTGTLLHRGWRSTAVKLPHATDPSQPHSGIVAPAEIELR